MIDTEILREYQEWRADNEERWVDISPEAFALRKAIDNLIEVAGDPDAGEDPDLVKLVDAVDYLIARWRVLNAPTD